MAVLFRLYQMFSTFMVIFFVCEFGHRVSDSFEETNNAIGELKWYLFPTDTWKLLPIVVAGAHKPVVFTVFGSVSCSRMDFQTVRKLDFAF